MASLRGKNQGITGFNNFTELIGQKGNDRGQRGAVRYATWGAEAINRIEHVEYGHANRVSVQQAQIVGMKN
ncbi:hypothetical protein LH22_07580 [Pantoea rwandensis]|uniref:Uncharacterized protein n=1 Tax=Pantoea rwandensis TaxID=1076550 RepID=A0ABM5RHB4_9GAMM|nr:hypothetical protein LH22_07580 [Pantoea rwandensis]